MNIILVLLVLLYSRPLWAEKETNTLINFPNIITKDNSLANYWIYHRQPGDTPPLPYFQPTHFNLSLTFLGSPRALPWLSG